MTTGVIIGGVESPTRFKRRTLLHLILLREDRYYRMNRLIVSCLMGAKEKRVSSGWLGLVRGLVIRIGG